MASGQTVLEIIGVIHSAFDYCVFCLEVKKLTFIEIYQIGSDSKLLEKTSFHKGSQEEVQTGTDHVCGLLR